MAPRCLLDSTSAHAAVQRAPPGCQRSVGGCWGQAGPVMGGMPVGAVQTAAVPGALILLTAPGHHTQAYKAAVHDLFLPFLRCAPMI